VEEKQNSVVLYQLLRKLWNLGKFEGLFLSKHCTVDKAISLYLKTIIVKNSLPSIFQQAGVINEKQNVSLLKSEFPKQGRREDFFQGGR